MRIWYTVAGLMCLSATWAEASTGHMTCDNPFRSYDVQFDDELGKFVLSSELGDTPYKVKSVQVVGSGAIFKGDTNNKGPQFEAYTSGNKRIEFFCRQ